MTDVFEASTHIEHAELRLPLEPDHEYDQTAVVSFDSLAGKALARHMLEISNDILNGRPDQSGNSRLVAVLPMWDRATLNLAHTAGFRTAEIDNKENLIGLELVPKDHRTRPVRVDIGLEITSNT